MYIGATESQRDRVWTVTSVAAENDGKVNIERTEVEYVPGLLKIFDEILVNAIDNKQRDPRSTNRIDVVVDVADGPRIRVTNNGRGVPIRKHKEEDIYIPELVFGNLLTGSNFEDDGLRTTGGRHGYGAKLTNIFSDEFVVETVDASRGLRYVQTWTENMRSCQAPVIETIDPKVDPEDYTRVEFVPDLTRFGGRGFDVTHERLLRRRVYDVAGCNPDVEVTWNGKRIEVSSFDEYARLFVGRDAAIATTRLGSSGWDVAVAASPDGQHTHFSLVNNMATHRGGSHVALVAEQLVRPIADHVARARPDLSGITPAQVKSHLFLLVKASVPDPAFDSQSKDMLTSRLVVRTGDDLVLRPSFVRRVIEETGIVEALVDAAEARQRQALYRTARKRTRTDKHLLSDVPKLEDATLAGGSRGGECSLILTEGDSAKALAVAGMSVVGRDRFGVFPLKGKLLNVRDASMRALTKNVEVQSVVNAIGLDFKETYETAEARAKLRYGHVMIMADQDHDGSHIKGLIVNLFHWFWPALLRPAVDGGNEGAHFLQQFVTPLVKARPKRRERGDKKSDDASGQLAFYSERDFNTWREGLSKKERNAYRVKYYKGLGTSTAEEAREYFAAMNRHRISFGWTSRKDGDLIDMAFAKDRAGDRREWIAAAAAANADGNVESAALSLPKEVNSVVSYGSFVREELVQFSQADVARSIPSVVDGLKPSQRKVLFACFKRKLRNEVKVAQLAGYVAEHTGYHHGEASLHATIVNMAQNFVGSNNVPLLEPIGQFGTRLQGGKDAASPRYIYTKLSPAARLLFPEADDPLLSWLEDDGTSIEPQHYVPTVPFVLLNGVRGIGTGWSTAIPSHHPLEVVDTVRRTILDPDECRTRAPLAPWFRGFTGTIAPASRSRRNRDDPLYEMRGRVSHSRQRIHISELPPRVWTQPYKEMLAGMVADGQIRSFSESHSESDVSFTLAVSKAQLTQLQTGKDGLTGSLKLKSSALASNMHALAPEGVCAVRRYNSALDVVDAFVPVRMRMYERRREYQMAELEARAQLLEERANFVDAVTNEALKVAGRPRDAVIAELRERGFSPEPPRVGVANDVDDDEERDRRQPFDHLLRLPLSELSRERIDRLRKKGAEAREDVDAIRRQSALDIWISDLDRLAQWIENEPGYERRRKRSKY